MRNRRAARWLPLIVALSVMVVVGGYKLGQYLGSKQVSNLRSAVYGECHRQNYARIGGNRNNSSYYKLFSAAILLLESAPAGGGHGGESQLFHAFLTQMEVTLDAITWTPLSNCEQATDHPVSYVPPLGVPFSKEPMPQSAVTIGPNE